MPVQTERVTKHMQALDPTRLYNAASGWVDTSVGHFIDMHKYVGPGAFNPTSNRASVLGEFGGLGLKVDNHQWIPDDSFSYEMQVGTTCILIVAIMSVTLVQWHDTLCGRVSGEAGQSGGRGQGSCGALGVIPIAEMFIFLCEKASTHTLLCKNSG